MTASDCRYDPTTYRVPDSDDLRDLRDSDGRTLRDVAEIVDVNKNTVYRWENNHRLPKRGHVYELVDLYDADRFEVPTRPELREMRICGGYTQRQTARYIGVHPNTVCRWEKRDRDPRIDNVRALLDLYTVPPRKRGLTNERRL